MDQVLGQSRAISMLQTALRNDRVPHAYVFHGPAGVGKYTCAVAFARVLLCHDRQRDLVGNVDACGQCPSCKLIDEHLAREAEAQPTRETARGRGKAKNEPREDEAGEMSSAHPDMRVVTKELARYSDDAATRNRKLTTIPVDVLREHLIEPVYRAAQLRHGKVFIVDEAELLSPTGQNLLLKTLEEPPAGTFIILVTAKEDMLLPTIRSRCHRIAFGSLPEEVVEQWVTKQNEQEEGGEPIDDATRRWLTGFANGSLGRASLARQYHLHDWAAAVLPAIDGMSGDARNSYPEELGEQIAAYIDEFAEQWVKDHANASKEAANKRAASLMWSLISQHAQRRLQEIAATCPPGEPIESETKLAPWLGVIDALSTVERELASNVNMKLACDHLVSLLYRAMRGRVLI